jgi:DNA-directed RNA polymerase sigma subunit (sigma70/sigma32)
VRPSSLSVQEDVNRALEAIPLCLSELETDVIKRRFGIGCPVHTVEHLTRIHPFGREHLRRIEKQALKTLHAYLEGKSTLLRTMIGLQPPAQGDILYGGQSFWGLDEEARRV